MSLSTELYVVSCKPGIGYRKSLEFSEVMELLEIKKLSKNYDDYIKPNLLYFVEDLNELARELNVDRIYPMGLYIRGIFGGEKKKEKEFYAGITIEEYHQDKVSFVFKLWNTEDMLIVPVDLLKKYDVKVFKMVYGGQINPFKLRGTYDVLLSNKYEQHLKLFLQEVIELNKNIVPHKETVERVERLRNEVRQPGSIATLNTAKYYVVYRCDRAFTALAYKPMTDNVIVHSNAAYAECKYEELAYYYAALLNYLAYKVIQSERAFIRHQWARPLLSIYMAGLAWRDVDEATRNRIIELSRILHEKAPDKEYPNQRVALKDIAAKYPEFKELVKLLDFKVDKERLEDALNIVSGKGVEEEE